MIFYTMLAVVFLVTAITCISQFIIWSRGAGEAEDYGEMSDDWSPHR